jgi:hypothetical protein
MSLIVRALLTKRCKGKGALIWKCPFPPLLLHRERNLSAVAAFPAFATVYAPSCGASGVRLDICWFLLDPIYDSDVAVLDSITHGTAFQWTGITAEHFVHLHAFIMGGAKRCGSEAIHLCGLPKSDLKVPSFCNRIGEYAAEERADA